MTRTSWRHTLPPTGVAITSPSANAPPDPPAPARRETPEADAVETPDEQLVAQVQAGDTAAFDRLIQRYKARLYATLYHMTSNHEDAADLLQETFIRAYRALPRFRRDARFSTWAHRIAVNVAINHLRQSRRRTALSLEQIHADHAEFEGLREVLAQEQVRPGEDRESQIADLQIILNQAIQTLSENHRAVVVMHDVQGMTHTQVAEVLGVPEGTVKTRLFHAHKLLRKKLARNLKNL